MDTRVHKLRDNWPGATAPNCLTFAGFVLDLSGHALHDADGREVALTPAEFALLETFVRNPGHALTRDQLLGEVAGRDAEPYDRSIDVLVGRLRRKIERDPRKPEFILTLPRVGYKFAPRSKVVNRAPAVPAVSLIGFAAGERGQSRPLEPRLPERRQITVMMCEYAGIAALSAQLDPEDVSHIVASCHQVCADAITRFGGGVVKSAGDGLIAYFGYPQAHEHNAERAIRAGLAAIAAVARLERSEAAKVRLRVGIATGPVVVGDFSGDIARDNYDAIGQAPRLAASLRLHAAPGTVVIAPNTRRLVGELFGYRALGAVAAEGFAEPIAAWQVIGERSGTSRFEALRAAKATNFIGRDSEIRLLSGFWSQAKAGEGRVVLITGEAGVGKSRLCAAFAERLGARVALRWQCSPHHTDSVLHPLIVHLEHAARFEREDSPDEKSAKLATLLGSVCQSEALGMLQSLLGLPTDTRGSSDLSAARRKQKILEALVAYHACAAEQAPILMLFEDVHWIDPTSLEFLIALVDRVRHLPALLLVTARREFAPSWPGEAHTSSLTLNRLSRRDAATLVLRTAGGKAVPEQAADEILQRTDCVPLFVEELTKAIIEGGHLVDAGNRYELAGPLHLKSIPVTLRDSLAARLDRLKHGKAVAQAGAAIGREFSHAILSAACLPGDAQALDPALDELVASELLFWRGAAPNVIYTFKHALVRDAAYDSMGRTTREACHARIAEAIEREEPGVAAAQPELLAYHYEQAALYEAALRFWARAGDLATQRSASREAAAHYRSALALLAHVPEEDDRSQIEFDLCMSLANVLTHAEGIMSQGAIDLYSRARTIVRNRGWTDKLVDASLAGASALIAQARYSDGLALFDAASRQQLAEMEPLARIRVAGVSAVAYFFVEKLDEAWGCIEQAIALDDAVNCTHAYPIFGGDPAIVLRVFGRRVRAYQGHLRQAAKLADEAVAIAEIRNHPFSVSWAQYAQAESLLLQGRYAESEAVASRMIDLCTRHGFEVRRAPGLIQRSTARLMLGRTAEGLSDIREGFAGWISVSGQGSRAFYAAQTVKPLVDAGLWDEAEEFLPQGELALRGTEVKICEAELLRLRGKLMIARGRSAAGEEKLRQALAISKQRHTRLFALRAATDLAALLHLSCRDREAAALLRPIHDWFTEDLNAPDLEHAAAVLATLETAG
jgi:class 3 adenylate cyclase/tetratricopeptide (TPR) repeat protein